MHSINWLQGVLLLLLLTVLTAAEGPVCWFNNEKQQGYAGELTSISVHLPEGPFSFKLLCGNGESVTESFGDVAPHNREFGCSYNEIGTYVATASITVTNDDQDELIECNNNSTITVSIKPVHNIAVREFVLPAEIFRGQLAVIQVKYENLGDVNIDGIKVQLYDETSKQVIDNKTIAIPEKTTKTVEFIWNTTSFSPGEHLLNASVIIEGSSSFNSSHSVLKVLSISDVKSGTTHVSAILNWSTNANSNYSLKYNLVNETGQVIGNSSLGRNHTATISGLSAAKKYGYTLTACSTFECVRKEGDFTTKEMPALTPTPSPSPTAGASPSPTATLPASPTPPGGDDGTGDEPPSTGLISPIPTPIEIRGGDLISIEIPGADTDLGELEGVLKPETSSKLKNASKNETELKELFNISITRIQFDPEIIGNSNQRVRMFAITDSESPLTNIDCHVPANIDGNKYAACSCELNWGGDSKRFKCEIKPEFPKALYSTYVLEVENEKGQSGFFAADITLGKKGSLIKYQIPTTRNEFFFYAGIFIALMLLGYALYHLLMKLEREQKTGEVLQMRKKKILEDMDTLKYHYLKRNLDYETYNKAMTQKQKELTEVNTRISEFESKSTNKGMEANKEQKNE